MLKVTYHLQKNLIWDNDIDFWGYRKRFEFVDIDRITTTTGTRLTQATHCSEAQIDAGLCEPYLILEQRSSRNELDIRRHYNKLVSSLSEVGGFGDLIFILLGFFYGIWNSWSYRRWFVGQVYPLTSIMSRDKIDGAQRSKKSLLLKDGRKLETKPSLSHWVSLKNLKNQNFRAFVLVQVLSRSLRLHKKKVGLLMREIIAKKSFIHKKNSKKTEILKQEKIQKDKLLHRLSSNGDITAQIQDYMESNFPRVSITRAMDENPFERWFPQQDAAKTKKKHNSTIKIKKVNPSALSQHLGYTSLKEGFGSPKRGTLEDSTQNTPSFADRRVESPIRRRQFSKNSQMVRQNSRIKSKKNFEFAVRRGVRIKSSFKNIHGQKNKIHVNRS